MQTFHEITHWPNKYLIYLIFTSNSLTVSLLGAVTQVTLGVSFMWSQRPEQYPMSEVSNLFLIMYLFSISTRCASTPKISHDKKLEYNKKNTRICNRPFRFSEL